jgi:pimeloyl-ACP methyl ester carboxylesterase
VICARVLAAAGCSKPFLFALSEGAPSAIQYAVSRPDEVAGLILQGASVRPPLEWALQRLRAVVDRWGEGHGVRALGPSSNDEEGRRRRGAYERSGASPAMARALLESSARTDVTHLRGQVRVPTLVLHRRHEFVPLSETELIAGGIPGLAPCRPRRCRQPTVARGLRHDRRRGRPVHRGVGQPWMPQCVSR